MQKLKDRVNEWQLIEKVRTHEKRGIIIGMLIAAAVILVVAIAIAKYLHMKKQFDGLAYDLDDLYNEEEFDDDDECCEESCCVTEEKDLEKI